MKNEAVIIQPAAENKTAEPVISIKGLYKSFDKQNDVLKGVSFDVNRGENVVVMGKSGSGKSVTVKCIAGLIKPDKGEIKVFDKDIGKLNIDELNAIRLRVGFLFQNAALYDSMTVRQNLEFPLRTRAKKLPAAATEKKIIEILHSVGLEEDIDKMPSELSGGMRKRVGLARTLMLNPEIILYDEPTTGLDSITAREISELIVGIQKKYKTTAVIITHDMACAKITGNRLLILKEGIIHARGTYGVLEKSEDDWVRSFF